MRPADRPSSSCARHADAPDRRVAVRPPSRAARAARGDRGPRPRGGVRAVPQRGAPRVLPLLQRPDRRAVRRLSHRASGGAKAVRTDGDRRERAGAVARAGVPADVRVQRPAARSRCASSRPSCSWRSRPSRSFSGATRRRCSEGWPPRRSRRGSVVERDVRRASTSRATGRIEPQRPGHRECHEAGRGRISLPSQRRRSSRSPLIAIASTPTDGAPTRAIAPFEPRERERGERARPLEKRRAASSGDHPARRPPARRPLFSGIRSRSRADPSSR